MPKYYDFKICGYYLYFTAHCIIECMHVHASDRKLTEGGSAKFFVKSNGDTVIQNRGVLTDRELSKIQSFIKDNYKEMYLKWASMSENGFCKIKFSKGCCTGQRAADLAIFLQKNTPRSPCGERGAKN